MKVSELFEAKKDRKLVVVYGGRFQPFHKGHYQAYKSLCKKFGHENVWLATSNKTNFNSKNGEVSPFNFDEKKQIMTSLYDIEPRRIVQCKNPAFSPKEVFKQYNGYDLVYVAACGEKDDDRYVNSGGFFVPLKGTPDVNDLELLADKTGYYTHTPMKGGGISGTKVREELSKDGDHEKKFKEFFGKYDPLVDELITARLKDIK